MAAAVDIANVKSIATGLTTNPAVLTSVTVASGATCLIVMFNAWANVNTTAVTYGAAGMTQLTSGLCNGTAFHYSVWYLFNPTVGTATVSVTNSSLNGNTFITAYCLTGSVTSSQAAAFGTVVETENTVNPVQAWSATATGAGASDLYLGMSYSNTQDAIEANGNMVQLYRDVSTFIQNDVLVDYIPGANAGLFSYNDNGNHSGTNTSGMALGFAAFGLLPSANPADGASITATVSTGTGGTPMIAVTAGQQIDVLAFAHVVTANTCTVADQLGNVYNQIDRFNDTAVNHNDFYRFQCTVTAPGVPVITATYGSVPASFNIGAAVILGINTISPFTAGKVSHAVQATASGTDAQTSGVLPTLAVQPATISGWGFSAGETLAPVAGSGFTKLGNSIWGAPFTGVCCTYETRTVNSTSPIAATFTPADTTHPMYTFAAAFNNTPPAVLPSGPMPRQIYVMP